MSGFDPVTGGSAKNTLDRLASVGGVVLGLFLLAGSCGHFAAVWPIISNQLGASGSGHLMLLLPSLMLMITGLINIGLCRVLWMGTPWAQRLALVFNGVTAIYLANLLQRGVPDHPIGLFLSMVASYMVVLGALRMGLVWPATKPR